jgi:two-component system cell cycle sensor histidine kinase/response regulator CckA
VDGRFASPSAGRKDERPAASPGGTETILVVEDQAPVRDSARAALERLGYQVGTAPSADDALRYVREGGELELLLTDVVLPGMNGVALAERVVAERPDVRVLFMSGYTSEACVPEGALKGKPCAFLHKPFSLDVLARAVRELLDRES